MKRILISIAHPAQMSGVTLICEVDGLAGAHDEWAQSLAGHMRDTVAGELHWAPGAYVSDLTVADEDRSIRAED